jgi:tetratricopeptide (TPR) repeat protein
VIAHSEARNAEAFELAAQALQIARALKDTQRQASALTMLGVTATDLQNPQAEAYLLECLEIREQVGDLLGMGRALNNLSLHYAAQGLPDESIRTLERALELQKRLGNTVDEAITLANIGAIYFDTGRYEKAKQLYQESIDSLESQGLQAREDVIYNLAEVEYKLGSFDQALARLANLMEITNEPYMGAAALVMSAEIALERGDLKLADQHVQAALVQAREYRWIDLENSSLNLISKLGVVDKPL